MREPILTTGTSLLVPVKIPGQCGLEKERPDGILRGYGISLVKPRAEAAAGRDREIRVGSRGRLCLQKHGNTGRWVA